MDTINRITLDGAQGHRDGEGQSADGEGQLVNRPSPEQSGNTQRPAACKCVLLWFGLQTQVLDRRVTLKQPVVGAGPRM